MNLSLSADEQLWVVQDVAKYLNVSTSWVYQAAAAGRIPCTRIGASLRFFPRLIRAWARGEAPAKTVNLPTCR